VAPWHVFVKCSKHVNSFVAYCNGETDVLRFCAGNTHTQLYALLSNDVSECDWLTMTFHEGTQAVQVSGPVRIRLSDSRA
jgi:hypothetical protein